MKKFAICSVAAAALFLSSCTSTKVNEVTMDTIVPFPTIEGVWETTEIVDNGKFLNIQQPASLNLAKPIFSIYGFDGLNSYFGNIKIEGTKLEITPQLAHTLMAGSEEDMAFGEAYLRALTHCDTIGLSGDKLVASGEKSKIIYETNDKGEWATTYIEYEGKEIKGNTATINIDQIYENINGNAGVNNFFGPSLTLGNTIKVDGELATTKMAGPKPNMDFEYAFASILPKINNIEFLEDKMILSNDNSKIIFTKRAE